MCFGKPILRSLLCASGLVLTMQQTSAQTLAAAPDPRIARGEQVLKDLNQGRQQPVLEAMRRDFPFLAEAT